MILLLKNNYYLIRSKTLLTLDNKVKVTPWFTTAMRFTMQASRVLRQMSEMTQCFFWPCWKNAFNKNALLYSELLGYSPLSKWLLSQSFFKRKFAFRLRSVLHFWAIDATSLTVIEPSGCFVAVYKPEPNLDEVQWLSLNTYWIFWCIR